MPIVTLTDTLLQKLPARDGAILRDRVLAGLCVRVGRRSRTFFIATSAAGQQVRLTLGRWPLLSVNDARDLASPLLLSCRKGIAPLTPVVAPKLPTLTEAIANYCTAKKLKQSSAGRYQSLVRTHFSDWTLKTVDALDNTAFRKQCVHFSQSAGAALVDVGRGLFGSLFNYLNVTYRLSLVNPFRKLAAAGLMPARAKPRARQLSEQDLPCWRSAIERLPEVHRDYLLLIAHTGLRRNECASLDASSVDFDKRSLRVAETKNGKEHVPPWIKGRSRGLGELPGEAKPMLS